VTCLRTDLARQEGTAGRPAGRVGTAAQRALRPVVVTTAVATYCLVVLGSTVRVTESGMGCPGWPLCNGRIGPVGGFHALVEQSHRYLAACVTIGVVVTVLLAWRAGASRRVLVPALSAAALVGAQVVLGAVTVVTHNAPPTVALHLVGALLLLAAVTVTAVASFAPPDAIDVGWRPTQPDLLAWSALVATLVLLVSGSIVVDGGASAACPSWPWCSPHAGIASGLVVVQLAHRAMAVVATALLVACAGRTLARRRRARRGVALAWALAVLLPAQLAAGATSALLGAPPGAEDVHLGLAAAIWGCAVALVASVHPSIVTAPAQGSAGSPRPVGPARPGGT